MNLIQCKYCQTPLQEHASFCPRCGSETGSREAATSISEKIPTVILTLSEDERTALSQKSWPDARPDEQNNATYISENIPTTGLENFSENIHTTLLENVIPLAEQIDTEEDDDDDNGILFVPGIPAPTSGAPLVNGVPQIGGAPSIAGTPHIGSPPQVSGLPGHAPFANIPPSTFPNSLPASAQPGNLPLTYPNPTPPGGGPGPVHPGGGPGPIQPGGGPGPIKTGGKGCIPWIAGISLLLVLIIVLLILFPPFGSQPPVVQAHLNIISSSLNGSTAYPGGSIKLHGQNFLPGGTVTFQENGQQVQTGGLVSNTTYQSIGALIYSQKQTQQTRAFQTTATVQADGTFDCTFSIPSDWLINSTHPVTASEHKDGKSTSARVNITVVNTTPLVQATLTPTITPTSTDTPTPTPKDTPTPTDTPIPPTVPPIQAPPPPPPTKLIPIQRQLSAQQTQSNTVPATGIGTTGGTPASGLLSIYNSTSGTTLILSVGTAMTNNGAGCGLGTLQIVLDSAVTLRPGTGANYPAHVTPVGTIGNIPAQCTSDGEVEPTFIYNHCILSCDWDASNDGAFTGGTDPQTYTFVQQSDIDAAAATLKTSTTQTATANIQSQVHSNEHLLGTPQCSYNVSADHKVGDIVGRFTVTVVAICTATAST